MTKDSNSRRSSSNMSSSIRMTHDPIDLELSDIAKRSFTTSQSPNNDVTIGKNRSTEQLVDDIEDSMFLYGSTAEENNNGNHQYDRAAMSPDQCRNEEENVIDILANVTDGSKAYDDTEHMVSRQEDSWSKTLAGVAGNVLEW